MHKMHLFQTLSKEDGCFLSSKYWEWWLGSLKAPYMVLLLFLIPVANWLRYLGDYNACRRYLLFMERKVNNQGCADYGGP